MLCDLDSKEEQGLIALTSSKAFKDLWHQYSRHASSSETCQKILTSENKLMLLVR